MWKGVRVRICVAGEGAIGRKHLSVLGRISGVEVCALVAGRPEAGAAVAAEYGVPEVSTDLDGMLVRPDIDAVVLATPTPLHADQAVRVLRAGKHCLVEIPMADNLADAEELARVARESGRVAMVCHTRRFNPPHRWVRARIAAGRLRLRHLVAQTFFLRRDNRNALGEPRDWTDHLLWHHACHTVDLFGHTTGERPSGLFALQGPPDANLGIAMDLSLGLKVPSGALCTVALSFHHDGPQGTTFRYVCDEGTYVAHYDDLVDGHGNPVDLAEVTGDGAADGIEEQDREFVAAVTGGREPESSVARGLDTMRVLHELDTRAG